ncbi:MAG: cupin domain-containing protein [Oscillospiraceae bacterium]|nr:cupin domain-containing protein [Oscillospiraceae bacterium]
MKLLNLDSLSPEFIWQDSLGLITKSLGAAAGSSKIYVNIDSVPQGGYSTKYHSHSQQEEFFLVIDGAGVLRLNDETVTVKKGDFIAKPGGRKIAHTFYNPGPDPLTILDVGSNEAEDTCYYPDEDVYLHKSNGVSRAYRGETVDAAWSSEPNRELE